MVTAIGAVTFSRLRSDAFGDAEHIALDRTAFKPRVDLVLLAPLLTARREYFIGQ
jgi:hypothetical protein